MEVYIFGKYDVPISWIVLTAKPIYFLLDFLFELNDAAKVLLIPCTVIRDAKSLFV